MSQLTPPDPHRCQAEIPTGGPFQLGGPVGDPKRGYRRRCDQTPTKFVEEAQPGDDGQTGSMTMCDDCFNVFAKQMPPGQFNVYSIGKLHARLARDAEKDKP